MFVLQLLQIAFYLADFFLSLFDIGAREPGAIIPGDKPLNTLDLGGMALDSKFSVIKRINDFVRIGRSIDAVFVKKRLASFSAGRLRREAISTGRLGFKGWLQMGQSGKLLDKKIRVERRREGIFAVIEFDIEKNSVQSIFPAITFLQTKKRPC
ncbi:hypothetical protein CFN16_22395 [Pseudomonas fluorescens]|uniref:Uncharacterized protein n=1 Tax=Pseudomonas fluorescens TaxID=294 RepID=A0A345V227_PSEFL|nr:hypothetical protein [Pseudomonas fluorescens]AXJ06779.1 hypothetical protein CFN16_22395 [Pseudomonas fluorescens]